MLIKVLCSLLCLASLTFHATHVSSPCPVLSRCHGGDIVFWVCVHGFTHEGAIHVDRVITANTILSVITAYFAARCIQHLCPCFTVSNVMQAVLLHCIYWEHCNIEKSVRLQRSKVTMLPFNGVLILCESPVCVWLLQLQEKGEKADLISTE